MQINKTMSFAISITSPDTTDAATDGGSASEPIMLRVTSSQFDLKSVLELLLRAESFKVCPAHRKNEKKRTSTIRLSKTKGIKSQPNNQILWKINTIDQNLHHFEVTIEYSR
jgi:hypothetical protein